MANRHFFHDAPPLGDIDYPGKCRNNDAESLPKVPRSVALEHVVVPDAGARGAYRGPTSRAYLSYNADSKHWVAPLEVAIKAGE
jgi:hypothetical protein